MAVCIICRKEKDFFNDEHVIPEAVGGYYIIQSVCTDCNSDLGSLVDSKLIHHKVIEFERYKLQLRGKKGALPNPFKELGTLESDPEQKIKTEMDRDGKFSLRLLPVIPTSISKETGIKFSLDTKDDHLKAGIIEKLLRRNNIDPSTIKFEYKIETTQKPVIRSQMVIDIKEFKIGMLKIAYEFAVDNIPNYLQDKTSKLISEILHRADISAMVEHIEFFDSRLFGGTFQPFAELLELKQSKHYLFLVTSPKVGLICQVSLFNMLSVSIKMSGRTDLLVNDVRIGVNDIENRCFSKYNMESLVKKMYRVAEVGFQYCYKSIEEAKEAVDYLYNTNYDFYKVNGVIPFFDKNGVVKYNSVLEKSNQTHLAYENEGTGPEEFASIVKLDEELYVLLEPGHRFLQVAAVRIINRRNGKI